MSTPVSLDTHEITDLSVAVLAANEVLCRGTESVLGSLPAVRAVHRCGGPDALARFTAEHTVDFLLVAAADAHWLEAVRDRLSGVKVLVLIDESAAPEKFGDAPVPIDGFLSQHDLSAHTLWDGLRRCARGELPMPSAFARDLLARAETPASAQRMRTAKLTSRETEALTLLVAGLSNKQIARRLAISSHGAKRLVGSIMLKLNSPNRTTAAVNAVRAGIVEGL